MIAFLPKEDLVSLLSMLGGKLEVIAPVLAEGEPVFSTWKGQNLAFDKNPLSPPTEFLVPQRETLFKYIQYCGRYTFEEEPPKTRMLLGIRPCDLKAITVLDKIFGSKPQDNLYFGRRRSTVLAVLNCTHSGDECLCTKFGSGPECSEGYDLLLTELNQGYLVETGSPAGMLILKEYSQFFEAPERSHLSEKRRLLNATREKIEARPGSLKETHEAIKRADWAALGRQCMNCGGCTFICPICHCFNIIDLGVPDGERIRCRDSCIFSGFSRMTSGVNPRRSQGERMQNWFLDKFEYIPGKTGMIGCVGCGRCSRVCLAEIDRHRLEVRK